MNLTDLNDLMAVAAGMNFAFIIINFIPQNNQNALTWFLNLYSTNSRDRAVRHSVKSIYGLQETRQKIAYCLSSNNDNPNRYDVLTNMIDSEESKMKVYVNIFFDKANSCLKLIYLPHLSLILGLYSIIVLWMAPFQETYKPSIENGLFILNFFTLLLILFTFINEYLNLIKIGFVHYFTYLLSTLVLLIISFFITNCIIFKNNFFINSLPFILRLTIFVPFIGISLYLFKTFLTIESQMIFFKLKVFRLDFRKKKKLLDEAIEEFEQKVKVHIESGITLKVTNGK